MSKTPSGQLHDFDAVIIKNPEMDAAYIEVPFDVKEAFGKSRVLVHATFDGEPYDGQLVKMGTTNHVLGVRKDIRKKIGKQAGQTIRVTLEERLAKPPEYTTINEYLATYAGEARERMEQVRALIHSCSPNITEKISWGMATFVLNGNLIHFAGQKNHFGLYPGAQAIKVFEDDLKDYKHSKGAVQFPYNEPMPYDLIRRIVLFNVHEQTEV